MPYTTAVNVQMSASETAQEGVLGNFRQMGIIHVHMGRVHWNKAVFWGQFSRVSALNNISTERGISEAGTVLGANVFTVATVEVATETIIAAYDVIGA